MRKYVVKTHYIITLMYTYHIDDDNVSARANKNLVFTDQRQTITIIIHIIYIGFLFVSSVLSTTQFIQSYDNNNNKLFVSGPLILLLLL